MIANIFVIPGTYDVVPAETHRPVPNQEFQVYVNYLRDNEDELMTQQFKVFHNLLVFH